VTVPTVGEHARLQQLVDAVGAPAVPYVAVVDDFGRILGAIDTAEHPDLFGDAGGPRVAGTARQRRRRDARARASAAELMTAAVVVHEGWPPGRVERTLAAAGVDVAFVVDDLGCVLGTVTAGRSRPPGQATRCAPSRPPVPAEARRRRPAEPPPVPSGAGVAHRAEGGRP
jgi:hypothetical protein